MKLTMSVVQAEVTETLGGVVATLVQIDLVFLNCPTTQQILGGLKGMGSASVGFKDGA